MGTKIDSTTRNYLWNMLGSVASALVSTILLLFASRFLSASQSDLFSILYSLSQLLFIVGLFQVRDYQATDVKDNFGFDTYVRFRMITILMMIGLTFIFATVNHYSAEKTVIFLILVLSRAVDAFSDVFQGFFQQQERSDLAGKILLIRSLAVMITFFSFLLLTTNLLVACIGMFVINLTLIFVLDYTYLSRFFKLKVKEITIDKQFSKVKKLLITCLPLFLSGFLITYIFNEPKLVIDSLLSSGILQEGLQRDFNILFMPTFVMSLLLMILRPLVTDLSELWIERKYFEFYTIVVRLVAGLSLFGLIVLVLGYFIGTEILGLLYGVPLVSYKMEFVILLVGGIFNVLAMVITNMMIIFRKQVNIVIVYVVVFFVSKIISFPLISQLGMLGATLSFTISMVVFLLLSVGVFFWTKQILEKKGRNRI